MYLPLFRQHSLKLFAVCSASITLASPAAASPLTAQQIMSQFNAVIFNNASSNSEIEGRVFVGGNATGGQYGFKPQTMQPSQYAGLTVQGNATNVRAPVSLAVGGSVQNSDTNGGAMVLGNAKNLSYGSPSYIAGTLSGGNHNGPRVSNLSSNTTLSGYNTAMGSTDFRSVMSATSDAIWGMNANSTATRDGGRLFLNATPVNGVAIFNLGNALTGVGEIFFNLGNASTVYINSSFASGTLSANFPGSQPGSVAPKVLWNFHEASDINFGTAWLGSILAVDATVRNGTPIEGTLVAENYIGSSEIHSQTFTGTVPVPEPAGAAMFLAGLLGLGAIARRHRK